MAAPKLNKQGLVFKGIFEFEDPSGSLLAARIPQAGSIDLYQGSAVIVRPNQVAAIVYKGEITDLLPPGLHEIKTDNVPILTRLANWKFGFESPLRAEIWFFSGSHFTSRKWGTRSPIFVKMRNAEAVPLRAYGQYNLRIIHPRHLYRSLVGSRSLLDVTHVDDFVQGVLLELLPQAFEDVNVSDFSALQSRQNDVSTRLMELATEHLRPHGLAALDLQIHGLQPPREMQEAIDAKLAMNIIGDPKSFLLYQAAKNLGHANGGANDPLQMMMGLMLGKGVLGASEDAAAKPSAHSTLPSHCTSCGKGADASFRFCPHCGRSMKP